MAGPSSHGETLQKVKQRADALAPGLNVRRAINHGDRFTDLLRAMEGEPELKRWVLDRAGYGDPDSPFGV